MVAFWKVSDFHCSDIDLTIASAATSATAWDGVETMVEWEIRIYADAHVVARNYLSRHAEFYK
jgi:hypothetical protein